MTNAALELAKQNILVTGQQLADKLPGLSDSFLKPLKEKPGNFWKESIIGSSEKSRGWFAGKGTGVLGRLTNLVKKRKSLLAKKGWFFKSDPGKMDKTKAAANWFGAKTTGLALFGLNFLESNTDMINNYGAAFVDAQLESLQKQAQLLITKQAQNITNQFTSTISKKNNAGQTALQIALDKQKETSGKNYPEIITLLGSSEQKIKQIAENVQKTIASEEKQAEALQQRLDKQFTKK